MKTSILALLVLAVSCGNPHLNKLDRLGSKNVPVIGEPHVLSALGIRTNNGLEFKTEEPSISDTFQLENLNIDKSWNMEFEFEVGTNFRFKGNRFPGDKGNCKEELAAKEKCSLEIEFHSTAAGFYADNLKIRYSSPTDKTDLRIISYSLRGERIIKIDESPALISVRTESNEKKLDFGKGFVGDETKSKLIVKNEGSREVYFETTLENNNQIKLGSGTCGAKLNPEEECKLDVSFNSSIAGLYQDKLIVSYEKQFLNFPILGEKIIKKKQGPLVASEVFSNNIDFGKVKTGVTVNKQVEIQNLGEAIYNVKDIVLENKEVFKVTSNCGDIIYPGTCLIGLSYTPVEARKDLGSLKVLTVEGDSVELKLSGEGETDRICESYNEYLVVPEKSYAASDVVFPYLKSNSGTTAKLSTLYGLEVNSYVKDINTYAVADGMVYVTFKLPEMEGVITNMNFGVRVLKVIRDNYKDTESLCLSSKGVRKCSGHEFSLASWQKLKNPAFWNQYSKPVSERYEKQFAGGEHQCGPYRCMDLNTQYELSDIFEMSVEEMKVLRKEGTLTLVFSDDTRMLKMPRIAIKTKVTKSCE